MYKYDLPVFLNILYIVRNEQPALNASVLMIFNPWIEKKETYGEDFTQYTIAIIKQERILFKIRELREFLDKRINRIFV